MKQSVTILGLVFGLAIAALLSGNSLFLWGALGVVLVYVGYLLQDKVKTEEEKESLIKGLETFGDGFAMTTMDWYALVDKIPGSLSPFPRMLTLLQTQHPHFTTEIEGMGKSPSKVFEVKVNQRYVSIQVRQLNSKHLFWSFEQRDTPADTLKRKYEWVSEIIEGSPMGIVSLSPSGHIYSHNQVFRDLVTKAVPTLTLPLTQKSLTSLLNTDLSGESILKLNTFLSGQSVDGPLEVYFHQNSSAVFNVYLSSIQHTEKLSTLYFVDVSEHKKLSLQLSQSQKMQAIGQLAGGIAHDFNNLLTAMIGYCDLLLLRYSPADLSFNDIMQIKQNANRAANLVRQLLAFSRQQTMQPKVIDITETLAELSLLLQRLIGPSINLRVIHARDLWPAKVDQGQFEQVIINMAVNARDAMLDGGSLTISTGNFCAPKPFMLGHETVPAGDYIFIKVTDTGAGIPHKNISRIFDPFFSTKAIGAGTGLGLSTVYGIVKQTGGFIAVESKVGSGTTFTIYLPRHVLCEVKAVEVVEEEPIAIADLSGAATILLVEDEDAVRLFSARALREKGYRVFDASNGPDALKIIENPDIHIDLVITDVVMAPMDGPSLARKIMEKLPHIKIIFISGYAENSFRSELTENADVHFLPKPFSLKDLARKVKSVMGGWA